MITVANSLCWQLSCVNLIAPHASHSCETGINCFGVHKIYGSFKILGAAIKLWDEVNKPLYALPHTICDINKIAIARSESF